MSIASRSAKLFAFIVAFSASACAEDDPQVEGAVGSVTQPFISPLPAEVRAGRMATCARRWDGRVVCWGGATVGQMGDGVLLPPQSHLHPSTDALTFVPALASGSWITEGADRACARSSSKQLTCWGESYGGWPNGVSGPTPALVPGITNVDQLALSKRGIQSSHKDTACARSGGVVRCWGGNQWGLLGNGTTDNVDHPTPATIPGLGGSVAEIALGEMHACARLTNGTVKCWGSNNTGQLGNGTTSSVFTVVAPIAGLTNVVGLALGSRHTCALKSDGAIRCWGAGGTIGDGTMLQRNAPHTLVQFLEAVELSAGTAHTCARLVGGTVQCWGFNTYGQLGTGDHTTMTIPQAISPSNIVQISAGEVHTCALDNQSTVRCWGNNWFGQVGDGTSAYERLVPTVVVGF